MRRAQSVPLSPLDGRYADAADELRPIFSEDALINERCNVELVWLAVLASQPPLAERFGQFPLRVRRAFAQRSQTQVAEEVRAIERRTRHDVKAAELWLAQLLTEQRCGRLVPLLHFGLTSWDVNNLAYGLMLSKARCRVLVPAADRLIDCLTDMAHSMARYPLLGRTHSQPATPTTMGKEMAVYAHRLQRQRSKLAAHVFDGKCNGAVGSYSAMHFALPDINWPRVARDMVTSLGLRFASHTTQIEPYDGMVEFFDVLVRANRILLDLAQDASAYAGAGHFCLQSDSSEVGSSTMPHKINPIDFENGEGNLALANALLGVFADRLQQSRLQRDLSDSTILRNMGTAFGHTMVAWKAILRGLEHSVGNSESMARELDANWQVLAEAVQTVLRAMGRSDAYDLVKRATRKQGAMDGDAYRKLVTKLVPAGPECERLLELTPAGYTGLARKLARVRPKRGRGSFSSV